MTEPATVGAPRDFSPPKRPAFRARLLVATALGFLGVCFLITSTEVLASRLLVDTLDRIPFLMDAEWLEVHAELRLGSFVTFLTRSVCCVLCFAAMFLWMRREWAWAALLTVVMPLVAMADNPLHDTLVPWLVKRILLSTH